MKKLMVTAFMIISAGFIAGCGSTSTPAASTTSISGKVADGYLVGATVFMDKNGNYQPDSGEPTTTTDQSGSYTLNVDPADVGAYPIVAMAIKGQTVDKDTNTPVSGSYVLSMPAAAVFGRMSGNFISPMSSQLRVMMDTGNYATMQDAMNALSTQFGRPAGSNMLTDYVAANDTAMHTAAQHMATIMASQMSQVLGTSGSTTTVDAGRYQGMMVAIFKNMPSIIGSDSNAQSAMTNLISTMTTTLQSTQSGMPFRNISSSVRGMMGGTGSSTIGGMMGGTATSPSTGISSGTTTMTGVMTGGTTTPVATGTMTGGTTTPTATGTMAGGTTTPVATGTMTGGTTTPVATGTMTGGTTTPVATGTMTGGTTTPVATGTMTGGTTTPVATGTMTGGTTTPVATGTMTGGTTTPAATGTMTGGTTTPVATGTMTGGTTTPAATGTVTGTTTMAGAMM